MASRRLSPGALARLRAALLAACVTAAAFCAGDAAARQYPFGFRTRDVNDLGNQFVPFHAHLWDLLHGRADGGLLLNWQSGYGTSFLPDFGTYVSSPFALLVGVFPRDRIDLAVYVVTVLKIAAAAAATACLLLALRPGRWWAAGLLGTSYALCGWTLMLASYDPMWLDGLLAFPLLCLVGEWARQGRRPVVSVLVVAVCWTANFYTAYIATIGAALVLAARLAAGTDPASTVRGKPAAVGRAALGTALGIGLTAPLLVPIVKGTSLAYPVTSGLPSQPAGPTCWYGCCPARTASGRPRSTSTARRCCSPSRCPSIPGCRAVPVRSGRSWSSSWSRPCSGTRRTCSGTPSRRPTAASTGRPSSSAGYW